MIDLRKELNESQCAAVEYLDGPQLVIAGAGSGKTRVLTYKIAHLIECGYQPWNIMALTFTNKAANEMKDRIVQLVGEKARMINMGTFHSLFARILRAEAPNIGYNSQFTIYDETDSRSLIKSIVKEMSLDDKVYKPATVHNRISSAKNNIMLPADYKRSSSYMAHDHEARIDKVADIYEIYQQRLRTSNAMDFDDLLLHTYLLFNRNEEIRQKYSQRFQYILVDEYQDTNSVQQKIVIQLVRDHHHVCVVGDDAQSIYGFRGANIDNILDFQQKFEGAQLFKLEQNYRSTQNIVQAANSLITHNQRQIPKSVYSMNDTGDLLQLKHAYSDREEAMIVCKDIKRYLRSEGGEYSDFAILYRTNAQSRTFEDQMRKDNIPYRIYGGLSFYQRKEIKDVIAYLRLVVNVNDEEALRRIINYPKRGIGDATFAKVLQHAHRLNIPAWDVISQPVVTGLEVSKATVTKLQNFAQQIQSYINLGQQSDAYELATFIIKDAGIANEIYSSTEPDDIARQENLTELQASLQDFVESRREEGDDEHVYLADFLQEVSLMSDLDSDDRAESRVTLMTIHSAKGLEFKTVFVVGMEENIFPSPMCADSPRKLEEERRLLYVAITRAEKHCILTCAQNRYRYGHIEFDTPSRFLRDIDTRFMSIHNLGDNANDNYRQQMPWDKPSRHSFSSSSNVEGGRRLKSLKQIEAASRYAQPSSPVPVAKGSGQGQTSSSFSAGDRIEHDRFGRGVIQSLEGQGENLKATVVFDNAGTKQLLMKFARLRKV